MFWSKNKQKVVKYRELAIDIKGELADMLTNPWLQGINVAEMDFLHKVSHYMDVFLTKCLKNNELTNKHWITARLIETDMILRISPNKRIQKLLIKLGSLQHLIMAGEIKNDNKGNKDSGSD